MMEELTIHTLTSLPLSSDIREAMVSGRPLGFDVETDIETNQLVSWQVYDGESNVGWFVQAATCPITTPAVKEWLEGPAPKIIHNAAFEAKVLLRYGVRLRNPVDTCLMARALTNGVDYADRDAAGLGAALKDLVIHYFGVDLSADKDAYQTSFRATQASFSPGQVKYGVADAYYAYHLVEKLGPELGLQAASVRLDTALVPYFEEMSRAGVPIDRDAFDALMAEMRYEIETAEKAFFDLPCSDGMFGTIGEFNMSAPEQVRQALARLGLKLDDLRKETVARVVSELESLDSRTGDQELQLEALRLHTRRVQAVKVLEWDGRVDGDDRIRGEFSATNTGRLTSRNHNILAMPAALRKAIQAPEGFELVALDYGNQEDRIAAVFSGDQAKIDDLKTGRDVFQAIADDVGVSRGAVKTAYYASLYGGGAGRISEALGLPTSVAKALMAKLTETYPEMYAYLRANKLEPADLSGTFTAKLPGKWVQVHTTTRRRLFKAPTERRYRAAAEREASNFPLQSTAADMSKKAYGKIAKRLGEAHPRARIVLFVHDEFVIECPQGEGEAIAELARQAMTESFVEILGDVVPCKIGGGVDRCYGNIK